MRAAFSRISESDRLRRAAQGAPATFALKVGATGATLLLNLLLARMLGVAAFGAYAYATTWASFLAVPAILGLDLLLLREVAAALTRREWSLLAGLLRFAHLVAAVVAVALAILVSVAAYFLTGGPSTALMVFWLAMVTVPLVTLIRLNQAAMRGLDRVVVGQLPELAVRPALVIVFVLAAYLVLGPRFDGVWAILCLLLASAIALVVGAIQLILQLRAAVVAASPIYRIGVWFRSAGPLLLVGSIIVINRQIDIILVGALMGLEAAGIYAVASRGAELISFVLYAVNASLAPRIASLYASGDTAALERAVVGGARASTLFSAPLAVAFILFGAQFLGLFGPGFAAGTSALVILSVARVADAFAGSVGMALTMTGNERATAVGMGAAAAANIALNLLLIPPWGMVGAATASATSVVMWNVILATMVHRRLGIATTAWGNDRSRARP